MAGKVQNGYLSTPDYLFRKQYGGKSSKWLPEYAWCHVGAKLLIHKRKEDDDRAVHVLHILKFHKNLKKPSCQIRWAMASAGYHFFMVPFSSKAAGYHWF
jgi:hypothetical protein